MLGLLRVQYSAVTYLVSERKMLEEASFYLQEGEKVGVIGINGTGKTTLLKIMAGLENYKINITEA